ncbi:MAG: hypothetical protein K0M48_12430, partial [Thiobacillus sp.]|nr:hypothetical protein [Thiobacillus sp.]
AIRHDSGSAYTRVVDRLQRRPDGIPENLGKAIGSPRRFILQAKTTGPCRPLARCYRRVCAHRPLAVPRSKTPHRTAASRARLAREH